MWRFVPKRVRSSAAAGFKALPLPFQDCVNRVRGSAAAQRAGAVFRSRTFRWTTGIATVGSIAWEAVDYFAALHEEHGMAELVLGVGSEVRRERIQKETHFRALIQQARQKQAAGKQGEAESAALEAHHLLHPTLSPGELRHRREAFGAVKWTEDALTAVGATAPLIEVGAGRGQWQKALADRGVDIIAFDDMSSPSFRQGLVGSVSKGSEDVVRAHGKRSLLLVYPNPGPMACRCLENYTGDTLVYVGEGCGGVNGDPAFFCKVGGRGLEAGGHSCSGFTAGGVLRFQPR